jgi:uncharacterized protein YjdB
MNWKSFIASMMLFSGMLCLSMPAMAQEYIADYRVAKEEVLRSIPVQYISKAKAELVVAYQHTSHGTHVSRGMFGLQGYKTGDDTLFGVSPTPMAGRLEFRDFAMENYAPPGVEGVDLSRDETAFVQTTRNYLDAPENATVNVVMWAWSRIAGHDVAGNYLPGMDSLISEYGPGGSKIGTGPDQRAVPVTFVFMTGHAIKDENLGPLNPKEQSDSIIAHCIPNQYFCHDYYTIDTHTMNDVYYEDTGDNGDSDTYGGNFYEDWQNTHVLGLDWYENWQTPEGYVAFGVHTTQHITSNRKAYAMWWILARIAGWDGLIPVSSVQISSENDTTSVMTGGGLQFYAEILPDAASDTTVDWRVISGSGSASIDGNGLLRGELPGEVEVLAMAKDGSGVADTMDLTILDPLVPVSGIIISTEGGASNLDVGATLQCSASLLPLDATNPAIVWSIAHITGSAQIGADGLVKALESGTVEVIAAAQDGSGVADTLELTIEGSLILVAQIEISAPGGVSEVESGSELQLTASVLPVDATDPSVEWLIADGTGSATISSEGLLTALDAGTVEVEARAMDGSNVTGTLILNILEPDAIWNGKNAASVTLYPNPGTGKFYIENLQTMIKEISVFDGHGKEIKHVSPPELTSRISIDLAGYPPGIYGLRISDMHQSPYFMKVVLVK